MTRLPFFIGRQREGNSPSVNQTRWKKSGGIRLAGHARDGQDLAIDILTRRKRLRLAVGAPKKRSARRLQVKGSFAYQQRKNFGAN